VWVGYGWAKYDNTSSAPASASLAGAAGAHNVLHFNYETIGARRLYDSIKKIKKKNLAYSN
jgi:hypothetical protein